ncbi:zinc finger CCCH domain-containing protein 18 isoform X1 [Gadus morhua]|uniref:zinc finger CCCH domain-containing protein 18 isoform X1 n=2 Tax=Gadus morhua TaxID=8049 RepID=UPI0011B78312|nr:zinc finger CCCH domain-containing protein 18-like isoform X1 [Gadus morhua]
MRPSSRRRAAAWLLALPAGSGGERCARRGRLEMISFWLLCWKLLRATAGLRRNAGELTDGNQDDGNQDDENQDNDYPSNSLAVNGSPPPTNSSEPVAMETMASSPPPTPETETHTLIGCWHPDAEELHFPEGGGAQEMMSDEKEGGREGEGEGEKGEEEEVQQVEKVDEEEGVEREVVMEGERKGSVEEEENGERGEGNEGGGAEEGVQGDEEVFASGPSQLLLSAMLGQSQDQGDDPSHGDPCHAHHRVLPLDECHPGDSGQPNDGLPSNGGPPSNGGQPSNGGHPSDGHHTDGHPSDGHPSDGHPSDGHPSEGHPSNGYPSDSHASNDTPSHGGPPNDGPPGDGHPSDDPPGDGPPGDGHPGDGPPGDCHPGDGHLSDGHPNDGHPSDGHPSDGHSRNGVHPRDGPPSDGHPRDGHPSDGPTSVGHQAELAPPQDDGHLSDSQLSDCLQAELAMVTSDSDTGEDQWESSAPHDIIDQDVGVVCSSEREEGEGEEEERGSEGRRSQRVGGSMDRGEEKEKEAGRQEPSEEMEEERRGGREQQEVQRRQARDVLLRSPSVSSSASSTDTDRKLPADFCVLQESNSENVFTEHLDFLLARQQWRKMEEEVKGKPLPLPSGRSQGSVQGTHSSLYPPTRSPHIQRRAGPQPASRETPVSSRETPVSCSLSPSSEDSGMDGMDDPPPRGPPEEPESAVEREIRLTLDREERHRRERGRLAQGPAAPRPISLQTGRSPPRPPACRTPNLAISPMPAPLPFSPTTAPLPFSVSPAPLPFSVSPSSLQRSICHELTANNVIILEPDSAHSRSRLLSPGGFSDWSLRPSTDVIVVETANLIIRSASEFCLSSIPVATETQESTFSSNPFFKLRSLSSQSLVEQEIRVVRQREEEWRRRRGGGGGEWRGGREKERFDTVLVSPGLNDNITFNVIEVPDRCVSSPSSPSRTRKMERSSMSCDHKFPPALSTLPRRQNAMAQRWEANLLANQKKE